MTDTRDLPPRPPSENHPSLDDVWEILQAAFPKGETKPNAARNRGSQVMVVGPYCLGVEGNFRNGNVALPIKLTWSTNKFAGLTTPVSNAMPDILLDQQIAATREDVIGWISYTHGRILDRVVTDFAETVFPGNLRESKVVYQAYTAMMNTLTACERSHKQIESEIEAIVMKTAAWDITPGRWSFPIGKHGHYEMAAISQDTYQGLFHIYYIQHTWRPLGSWRDQTATVELTCTGNLDATIKALLVRHYLQETIKWAFQCVLPTPDQIE